MSGKLYTEYHLTNKVITTLPSQTSFQGSPNSYWSIETDPESSVRISCGHGTESFVPPGSSDNCGLFESIRISCNGVVAPKHLLPDIRNEDCTGRLFINEVSEHEI